MKQSFHHFFSPGGKSSLYPPAMNLPILVAEDVLSAANCAELAREVIRREARLLEAHEKVPVAGLSDGLTTRWLGYNILEWEMEPVFILRRQLRKLYLSYLKKAAIKRWPNEVQCWGNILRKGESLKPHCHNFLPRPALTMSLALTSARTHTVYQFPFPLRNGKTFVDQFSVETKAGTLVMVPGWVNHFTTPHQGPSKRVTLGLDIASDLTRGARIPFDDGKKFIV